MYNNIGIYILISIISIIAIIMGPILAVQAESWLSRERQKREQRLQVFRILMLTRKIPLSPLRIDALNSIDFYFDRDEEVTKKWREYLAKIKEIEQISDLADEKFIDLLEEMAKALGYKKFDKTYIRETVYLPQEYSGYLEGSNYCEQNYRSKFINQNGGTNASP